MQWGCWGGWWVADDGDGRMREERFAEQKKWVEDVELELELELMELKWMNTMHKLFFVLFIV